MNDDLRQRLQGLVEAGERNDCDALAEFAENQAFGSREMVSDSFGALTNTNWASWAAGIARVRSRDIGGDVRLNRVNAPTGFARRFQNGGNENVNADQSHHFAAFFQIGFHLGAVEGEIAAVAYDLLTGNAGDRNLGTAAATLGAMLKSGAIRPADLGREIRSRICQ